MSVDRTKMAFRIIETKRNKVLSIQYGSAVPGSKITMCAAEGRPDQLWKFLYTDIPGVFYISTASSSTDSQLYITVPENVQAGNVSSQPTLEKMLPNNNPRQLWRVLPSGDGAATMFQNYDFRNGNGLVLDTNSGSQEGQVMYMYSRSDNDYQKWYIENQYER